MARSEYDRMAQVERDHWWYRALRRRVMARLDGRTGRSLVLLDAGCGTGEGLRTWSGNVRSIGLDLSEHALRHCRDRGIGPLIQGSVDRIPLASGSVDTVVCLDVLCLEGIDERRALREIKRVLAPGGRLILNLPAFEQLRGQHDIAVRIRHRYSKAEVAEALRRSGFEAVAVSYWDTALFPLVWIVRRLRQPGRSAVPTSDLGVPPGPLNSLVGWLLRVESTLLGDRAPFGTSVFAVATVAPEQLAGPHDPGRGEH